MALIKTADLSLKMRSPSNNRVVNPQQEKDCNLKPQMEQRKTNQNNVYEEAYIGPLIVKTSTNH